MSGLEDRCAQFHDAATGAGKSKGPAKEMATLRRFLYKNQSQRFSDKAAARLFDTISIYVNDKKEEGAEELLEDALKMPFTVFSTRQKSKMLKWMEALRGGTGSSTASTAEDSQTIILTVTDVLDDQTISLMNAETGDSWENVAVAESSVFDAIQSAFQSTDDAVDVKAKIHDGSISKVLSIAEEADEDDAKSSTCSCCG